MNGIFIEPWFLPEAPPLARLAMEAADEAGLSALRAWPEPRKGGVGFLDLPPFLPWHGLEGGRHHLVLLQAREVGALVPGARVPGLPRHWLRDLDLGALARPLARHPALGGAASIHVVHLPGPDKGTNMGPGRGMGTGMGTGRGPGRGLFRTLGEPGGGVVEAVLVKLTGQETWEIRCLDPGTKA